MAGSYYQKFDVRIGIVCDTILYESLSPAADFVYLSRTNWRGRLNGLDVVLIASVWRGLDNDDWDGAGRVGEPVREELLNLVAEAKRRGIATIFYSKEDPPNYRIFLDYAKACDFVFTSAAEMVDSYRRDCGHDRVGVLRFCFNPAHDNPIGCMDAKKNPGAVFSGSWMVKYPLRCRDLATILDGIVKAKKELCIVNRNSFRGKHPWYRFPRRFRKFERPAMPHAGLSALHREYDWSVNVNSVTSSETMFAARCYELLAGGCLVISNFSAGMLKELPEIAIADTSAFARSLLTRLDAREKMILRRSGIRRVMSGNTCYDRVSQLLNAVGIRVKTPSPKVSVVVPDDDASLRKMFEAQSYRNIELVVGDANGTALSGFDYVTYWKVGEIYGRHFIQDLLDVFKYADVDFAAEGAAAYCRIDKPVPGRTLFKVGADARRGFSIGKTAWGQDEENRLIESIHEITVHPRRNPDDDRAPLIVRALACLYDNGLSYTLKRVINGKR